MQIMTRSLFCGYSSSIVIFTPLHYWIFGTDSCPDAARPQLLIGKRGFNQFNRHTTVINHRHPSAPLHRRRRKAAAEATLHRSQHDVLYSFTVEAARAGCPVQCFTIAAVQRERDTQVFTVITAELNPSGAPPLVAPSRPLCRYVPVSMGWAGLRSSSSAFWRMIR